MGQIIWNNVGEREYETGVDRGVLYSTRGEDGAYSGGVPWNGLTTVTESPSGAEPTPLWADNIKYVTLMSIEEFGATIEAFMYPDEFMLHDGSAEIAPGVYIGQQNRKPFGFSYRTLLGNDTEMNAFGYKLHLIYNGLAAPSEKPYATVNDSPEAINFSWEITTTPVPVTGEKPTASITIDSTKTDPGKLKMLENILYGVNAKEESSPGAGDAVEAVEPRLPLPDEIAEIMAAA